MRIMRLLQVLVLCFFTLSISAVESDIAREPAVDAGELDAALQRGLKNPEIPFQLQINCTDQKGIRSMELFAGGATIWNRRKQVMLPDEARITLLENLISHGFATFESHYGGHGQLEKAGAAARMTCRIQVEIEGLRKSSAQQAGGQQSAVLSGLASLLLDEVEQYEDNGVTPSSLQDALDALVSGRLAPQILKLRFMNLPVAEGDTGGFILRLYGGQLSRQAYSPGDLIGDQAWQSLDDGQFFKLAETLQATQLESLPGNLYSEDPLDFEIQLLGYKKVVIARTFKRLQAGAHKSEQQRFDSLVRLLKSLNN